MDVRTEEGSMAVEVADTYSLSSSLAAATPRRPELGGLAACIEDARRAALDADRGPAEPNQFHPLRGRIEAVRTKLPPLYRDAVVEPFARELDRIGDSGFTRVLTQDPSREGSAGLLLDCAQAILQQGEGYAAEATDAFQEVVSDLYDGFLSAEDRRGVKPPDLGTIAPLVKWGNPDFGPYTWPVDATKSLRLKAGVVNLPPANRNGAILAWAALGHEAAGHDILHADKGLQAELTDALRDKVGKLSGTLAHDLADYWADRIDETASDVLGILNMGPAAAIGLVGYFRGLNAAWGSGPSLRNDGPEDDPHPADIVRGMLAAETVRLLSFSAAKAWGDAIDAEVAKDTKSISLGGQVVPAELARQSARAVADTLVNYKAKALERHALGSIQNWRNTDETKVARVGAALRSGSAVPSALLTGTYAAHVVSAAVVESLADGSRTASLFQRAVAALKAMHDGNPSWGPLFVAHPGDITRDVLYTRHRVTGDSGAGELSS
jgi:hypothetical protein